MSDGINTRGGVGVRARSSIQNNPAVKIPIINVSATACAGQVNMNGITDARLY